MFIYEVGDKVTAIIDGFYDNKGREKPKQVRAVVVSQPAKGDKFYLLKTCRGGHLIEAHEDLLCS